MANWSYRLLSFEQTNTIIRQFLTKNPEKYMHNTFCRLLTAFLSIVSVRVISSLMWHFSKSYKVCSFYTPLFFLFFLLEYFFFSMQVPYHELIIHWWIQFKALKHRQTNLHNSVMIKYHFGKASRISVFIMFFITRKNELRKVPKLILS